MRRTKIVCTLGPATSTRAQIDRLIDAGMDVARVNFSHGTHPQHRETIRHLREAASAADRPVAILGDLQGPKIRVGVLPEALELAAGDVVTFAPEEIAEGGEIPTTYEHLAADLQIGDVVLLADGLMELIVEERRPPRVTMRVIHGGTLTSNKGINLPGVLMSVPALTRKDVADLAFALEEDVDYLGLSFVRRPEDVEDLLQRVPENGPLVVVKIEKGLALKNLRPILNASAAAMVARGDLGVELPFEQVPLAQKRMIQLSKDLGRPVITATQMLESMIDNPRPTRAEASDVANAILDGTDAVMLSAETAIGSFAEEAVKAMVRIAAELERSPVYASGPAYRFPTEQIARGEYVPTERAVAAASVEAVRLIGAPVIITFTRSGFSARIVSSFRPPVPILAVTDSLRTYNQLALVWGVIPLLCQAHADYEAMMRCAREYAFANGVAEPGDRAVTTAGWPMNVPGTTNLMRVETL